MPHHELRVGDVVRIFYTSVGEKIARLIIILEETEVPSPKSHHSSSNSSRQNRKRKRKKRARKRMMSAQRRRRRNKKIKKHRKKRQGMMMGQGMDIHQMMKMKKARKPKKSKSKKSKSKKSKSKKKKSKKSKSKKMKMEKAKKMKMMKKKSSSSSKKASSGSPFSSSHSSSSISISASASLAPSNLPSPSPPPLLGAQPPIGSPSNIPQSLGLLPQPSPIPSPISNSPPPPSLNIAPSPSPSPILISSSPSSPPPLCNTESCQVGGICAYGVFGFLFCPSENHNITCAETGVGTFLLSTGYTSSAPCGPLIVCWYTVTCYLTCFKCPPTPKPSPKPKPTPTPVCKTNSFKVGGYPTPHQAGVPGTFTVQAINRKGQVCTNYNGIGTFSSNDVAAQFPAQGTITAGIGTFSGTFHQKGNNRSIGFSDGVHTGQQTRISIVAGPVAKFNVFGYPSPAIACDIGTLKVQAVDAYGNLITNYAGTVQFTSSDLYAALPPQTTFTAANHGGRSFTTIFKTVGNQTITCYDISNPSIQGSQSGIIVVHGPVYKFAITVSPNPIVSGQQGEVCVTALDRCGNVVTNYLGTVTFTSNDLSALLPPNYTFIPVDMGHKCFPVTFNTTGSHTITVSDSPNCQDTGTTIVQVN